MVLRACGGCHASSNGSLESSLQSKGRGGASLGPGDLNVTSCSTPKVRSLDGVACALLCVELKPCRLHVVLLRRANCRICKRDVIALMKVVIE